MVQQTIWGCASRHPHPCACIRQIMRVLGTGIDIGIQSVLSTGNNTLLALAVVNGLLHLPVPVLLSQSSGFSTVTHIFSRCHDNIGCSRMRS